MDRTDKLQTIYSALQNEGYTDLGDFSSFSKMMEDESKLRLVYDGLIQSGYTDVGEFSQFSQAINPVSTQTTVPTSKLSQGRFSALVEEETPEEKAAREAEKEARRAERKGIFKSYMAAPSNVSLATPNTTEAKAMPKVEEPKLTPEQIAAAEDERLFKQHLEESGQIQDLYNLRDYARENDGSNGIWDYINPLGEKAPIGGTIHLLRSAFSEDYRDKKQAQKRNRLIAEQADKAIDVYEQATGDRNGISSVFNAVADEASRISTWDLGMTDLQNAATLYNLSQKDESELTASEKATLDAIGLASSVMSLYGDEVGAGYKIGQGVPATLSFMGSMALNPAAGYGKKLAGDAVKKFGKDYVKRVAKRAAGDIIETGAYVGTVALPQVGANALDRINGSTTYDLDDDLNVVYGGQEDQETLGNAIWKAFGETFIEGYTERVGDYFDPIIGFAKGVTKGIKAGKLSDFAEALVEVKPTATMQNIRRFKEKTLFNGTLSELMEEELGMAMNAFTVGDYTFDKEKAEKEGKTYIFDPENQFVTAMSVGMFSAAINGTEMAANHAYKRKVNKTAEEKGKIAERELGAQFSEMIDGAPSLRERIDNADADEKNRILADIWGNPNLNDRQKAAVAQYAIYRQYAQTFNAVQANALNHKADEVKEQHAAYEAGYSSALPAFYNIANAFKEAEQAISDYTEKAGDSSVADAIRLIENNPSEIKNVRDGLTDEQYQLVTNYINNLERYKGAYKGRSDKLEDYVDEYAFALEPAINADANGNRTITTAIYKGEPVYVLYNDGTHATIMKANGDRLQTDKQMLLTRDLSEIVSHDAEQYINDYRQRITGQMSAETENAFEHHPKTQAPHVGLQLQSPEGEVVITAVNDNMVEIVPTVYKDGQVQPKEGAEPKTITVDDAYAWQDDYYLSMDADQAYANAMAEASNMSAETTENEGTSSEQIEQSVSEEVTDGQNVEIQPTEEVAESVAPAAPQTARERVPKDDKGNPIYEQTDADTAWDAIVEETEGNVEMAQRVAADMLEDKKASLAKLQKGKPKKGATVAEKIANEKAHAAAIAQAQNDVAQWEAIVGTEARRREAAISEAERYAAEMEQKNINEGLAALGEPQSLEEYVLGQLAGGAYKLRWSDKENGTKGFGSHTGLSTEEMKARLSMIDNKNGLTPEEVAHVIVENMDSSFGEVDVMDVTNMVIDAVATNASRRAMLDGMVESRAELMRQQARAEQEAKDAWYMEQYHATEEELAAYSEYLAEITEEIIADDANYEERFNTFAELIADEYDNQGTDADIRSSADQGEGLASDREGSSSVGEGEETDRQGAVLGDATRFAEAEDGRAGSSVSAQSNAERIGTIKAELGVFGADNAAEYANRLYDIYQWKSLEEANEVLKAVLRSYDRLSGQSLGVLPYLDQAQKLIKGSPSEEEVKENMRRTLLDIGYTEEEIAAAERDGQRYEADMAEDAAETVETLENGDVRITNRNSNGEIATVAIERDGKVISVDTYEDGVLFEHTDYDANGNATKVTRYKDGEVVSEQEYKDGKRKVTADVFEMAEEAQKDRDKKKAEELLDELEAPIKTLEDAYKEESKDTISVAKQNLDEAIDALGENVEVLNILADRLALRRSTIVKLKFQDYRGEFKTWPDWKAYDRAVRVIRKKINEIENKKQDEGESQSRTREAAIRNKDEQRQANSQGVADDGARGVSSNSDRGDIRMFEEGLAALRAEHSDDSERTRRAAESERLVNIAKQHGKFISNKTTKALTGKVPKRTGESVVYIDTNTGKVAKVKDPYAKSAMKSGVQPEDAIFEHLVHNLLFPETAYTFVGISEEMGDVRIVLLQDYIPSHRQPTKEQIAEALAARGLFPEDNYSFGNEFVSVTDVEGDNVLLGDDGIIYFIDPIIRFKKPLGVVLSALEAQRSSEENLRFREKEDNQDAAYMDAVERGDMETAQRMVNEAARKAMKKTKVVDKDKQPMLMSHHTDAEGFYVFDRGKIGTGQGQAFLGAGFNFSRGSGSSVYGSRNIQAYLDARKPLRSDRNTLSIYQIEQIIKELNAISGDDIEYNFADNISRAARAIYEYGGDLDTYASLCTAYSGETRDVLEAFEKLGFDSTIEYGDDKRIINAVVFNSNQIKSADPVTYDDNGNVIPLSERFNLKEEDIRFRDGSPFFSNAERVVENIKQNKATPEQWLAMIKKDGGLKAGEDKWMGLSDWLNEQKTHGVKTLTKDEVLQFIRENQIEIEEVEYGDNPIGFDELKEEYETMLHDEGYDAAHDAMIASFGDDFDIAFEDLGGELAIANEEVAAALLGSGNIINSTRLEYTTEGLDNKREIALVVPTIDSWNRSDIIHFGDAGEGRAVAWVRFGETIDEDGKRVLVIDEVQSKRHDEGRAKGYQSKEKGDLLAERDRLYGKMYRDGLTEEEFNRRNEINARLEELGEGQIPDAPFDKNYHELVMKRMLRYAAENGFDKVAWTKGAQQAQRYNLNKVFDSVEREDNPSLQGKRFVLSGANTETIQVGDDGVVVDATIADAKGKTLESVVGVDMAKQMMSLENGDMIEGQDFAIGGEGMKGFYDEMIPRFMNKYTKKWGTKVGEVTLPKVEEAGRTMWSVDVTPEMRESVMQGQPMFREGMGAISDREVSYENDPIAKFQGKPRYYGKRAAAFAERERRRMENAAKEAAEMLGIEAEIITDASTLQGRKAKAKGWYDIINKKVVVVVPNHVSMGDAVRTVLHEGVAHHGLRELFGDGFDAMLDNVYNNVAPELKARIDAIAERTGVSTSVATEEYLASLAETTNFEEAQRRGWWAKIKQYFVNMLNKLGMPGLNLKEELTDNELRYLLWRSYKNLVEPNSYLKPLGYIDDVAKQKELKVGEYAEKKQAAPRAAEMSEAEEWAAVTMQRIEELEAQAAHLENEIAEMEAKREADDTSRYDMWEGLMMPLRMQLEDVYAEIEGLYTLSGEEEVDEEEREADKQRQLYQKRIDNAYLKAVREGDWEEATDLFRQYVLSKAEDEGIVPMDYGVGYRGGAHSSIAKKVKEENPDAIAEAAYQMSIRIPKGSILVPMPSRTGNATYTVKLAEAIAKATDSEVRDVLKGKARMSVYEAKQKGIKMTPEDLGMYTTEELPKGKNIVIIDNVIDKGTTALAAVSAVKGASVVAYAYTLGDKQRVASLKLAEPVTYDDNKRIIPLSQRFNKETDDIRYRLVDDPAEIERLESEPTIKAYRAMQVINGELYPPMSAVVDGKLREPIALGQWERSEEQPELADDDGRFRLNKGNKKGLKAAYNPYFHSSATPLNDQFAEAQDRPNLVTVEVEIPQSEADGTSGYKAEKAKDAVGTHQWKAGAIQGQISGTRTLYLSRWDKPVRIVPDSEVAGVIAKMIEGTGIVMPSNVVTPSLRAELEKLGVPFVETTNRGKLAEGEHKGEGYGKVYGKKSTKKSKKKAEIIAEVEREAAALGVPVRIVRSVDELPDAETRKRAVDGQLKGYFDPRTGEVVLYEPNTNDANDAKRTVLHEIVGHKGLRSLIGEQRYDKAMLQLMYMLPADVRDAVLRRAERHGWNAAIAMDEYLADQAERDVQPTWWGKVNAKIRAILRNIGFNVKLTDADVTYLLWRSRKKLQGDSLNDMAVNAILKQAARKSAEAEAWNEQAFQDAEMRDFESNALPSIRHRMGADTNDYENAVRTLGFKQAESWQDSMRSLLVFQQAIAKASGKDISDFENAYMYENRMSSANLMEMEQYRHMVYNPLLKEIHELEQMGASRESIINYLFAKSGLERNEVFARRDAKKHAEGDAAKEQQLYDKYRQKDYAGLTALTRDDAQIAGLVDDHSKKKTEYDRLEQNKKRGVAVSDADLKAAKKEMNDARKAMITAIEAEAQRMVDEFEAQHNTDNLWDKIRNCTHTTLNISHDAGVMSDEVYNELWNQFQYYIPLRGFAETTAEDVYLYLGGSDSPYNAPIKTAYGRTSLADDPIATIGNMAESAIVEANRNRLKQRFLYMVERHNTDLASISDVWLEYDDVNDEWHTVLAQIPDDATPSEAKRLQQEFEDRMKLLAEQNPGKYANASQQPNIPYRVVKKGDRQEHHVIVKRNGKDVVITINGNPRVAQAINGLTNPEQNQGMITRITSWINRNLSANFTMRNPAFMVSNFVRDGFYTNSMVWVKENPAYARQYNKNWAICTAQIASLVKRYKRYEKGDTSALDMNNDMDRMFYEFMINGGETGYTVIRSVEDYKGLISGEMKKMEAGAMGTARRVADTIGNAVDTFGRWAEDTSRFAAYMTSRQLGRTITKSIWDAKEISVNFNKKGSGNRMMGKFEQGNRLNYVLSNMSQLGRNLYVFWNAGVQGFNNFKKAAKDSPAKFTAMAGTYFALGVIVAAAFSGDDDEDDYYNLPEYVRRNNICFKIGKGKYATLPLPIEIRAIYGLGELAYSYLSGREGLTHGEAVTKTIQQITQVLPIDMMADGGGAMALVPSAAKPVVEVIRNVDWTGRPIYKEKTAWNQNDPTWTLAFKSTSPELVQMSRLVNEWTNKNTADGLERPYNRGWADNRYLNNPAVWEHIAEGYLGGIATMFNQTKKTLMMPFNEDLREMRNVPIASRFIKDAGKEGRSYAARNEYYEAKNIMDSRKNEMSKAKKEVLDESLTDEQRLKAAKLRSSLEQQYMEAAERWKVLDRQRKALEEAYKGDQSEENRQALDDVMMQMATLVEAYK